MPFVGKISAALGYDGLLVAVLAVIALRDATAGEKPPAPNSAPAATARDYFPMALGDRWVYRKTVRYPGEEPAVSETYSLVRGEYLFNEEVWRHFEEDGVCFWVHIRDDGQYEADVSYDEETLGLQIDREFPVFRFPVKAGDEWLYLGDAASEGEPGKVRCSAVDKLVKTPAGKFKCLVYELDEKETTAVYRYAAGVGLVSCEWKNKTDGGESVELELKRYLPGRYRPRGTAAAEPPKLVE